jgi:hypothetical protein
MRRLPIAAVSALAAAHALAGCSDGSLSADQLRSRASAICTRAAAATDRIPVPSSPDEGVRFLRAGAARLLAANHRLGRLKAPEDLRAGYKRAVALGALELGLIEGNANAIARGADAIDTFHRLEDQLAPLTDRENAHWRALEVPACVRR